MKHNRFAIVKLWEGGKSAEDENIERIISASKALGVECVPVDRDYRIIGNKSEIASEDKFDFIMHLHFDSVKLNNLFSMVALWNPLQFYFDWGYRRFSDCLLTHDDFISCRSSGADRHLNRLIGPDLWHQSPVFEMFHSISGPVKHVETRVDRRLFYCGINWERLGKKRGRHADLLEYLDANELVDIYGPKSINGVATWSGYKCYRGEIPFDGVSMPDRIAESGIALVLSSEAHIQSELMSNRLFESIAAGAVVICDQNPFAKKFFGDDLYYINTKKSPVEIKEDVVRLIKYINENPEEVNAKIASSQKKFNESFELKKTLKKIFNEVDARKEYLNSVASPSDDYKVTVIQFVESKDDVDDVIFNIKSLKDKKYTLNLLIPEDCADFFSKKIEEEDANVNIRQLGKEEDKTREIIEIINSIPVGEYFGFIGKGERILSDHYSKLVKTCLVSNSNCAISNVIEVVDNGDSYSYSPHRESLEAEDEKKYLSVAIFRKIDQMPVELALQDLKVLLVPMLMLLSGKVSHSLAFTTIARIKYLDEANVVRDANLIEDCYPGYFAKFVKNRAMVNQERQIIVGTIYERIKERLKIMKKYPTIWKMMKWVQRRIE